MVLKNIEKMKLTILLMFSFLVLTVLSFISSVNLVGFSGWRAVFRNIASQNFLPDRIAPIFFTNGLVWLITTAVLIVKVRQGQVLSITRCLLTLLVYFCTFLLAAQVPMSETPDEIMRLEVPAWILKNHRLPIGNETELTNNVWGFSYAFLPYLPGMLGVPMMGLLNMIAPSAFSIMFGARMVSVISVTALPIMAFKVGDTLFKDRRASMLLAVCISLVPQIIFIGSYANNDAFTLLAVMFVIYSLVTGDRDCWSIRSCVYLSLGLSMCILSYYNSAIWIPISIIVCIASVHRNPSIQHKLNFIVKKALIVIGFGLIFAAWFFIRNYIIHQGDLLGIRSQHELPFMKAATSDIPLHFPVAPMTEMSLSEMLFQRGWINMTFESIVCVLGCMDKHAPSFVLDSYKFLALFGLIGFVLNELYHKRFRYILLVVLAAFSAFALSIYRSFTYDYQPQGRYVFPGLATTAMAICGGCRFYDKLLAPGLALFYGEKTAKLLRAFSHIFAIVWIYLFAYCYWHIALCQMVFQII